MAAAGHADDVVDLHFAAGADAEIALDAGVEIDRHRYVAAVRFGYLGGLPLWEAARLDFQTRDGFPKLGIRIVRHIHRRLIGEQELGDHLARGFGAVGLGLDLHARRGAANAACGQHALAFDLDHADAAIAIRPVAGLRRIAQVRQLDIETARGVENRLAFADIDLAVVDGEGFGRASFALAGGLIGWRGMRYAGFAVAIGGAARGAFLVVAVADWFVRIVHDVVLCAISVILRCPRAARASKDARPGPTPFEARFARTSG